VIKCGFISDQEILKSLDGLGIDEIRANRELVQSLISRAVAVKAHVVSEDFKEGALREILNYGHTFGHAIETHSQYALRHGEAVSIGMILLQRLLMHAGSSHQHYSNITAQYFPRLDSRLSCRAPSLAQISTHW
jgi:3-dehydroquinate synthetase